MSGDEPWWTALQSLAFQQAPFLLPRLVPGNTRGFSLYLCGRTVLECAEFRDELYAMIGPSFSHFRTWLYPLSHSDSFEQQLGSFHLHVLRIEIPTEHISTVVKKILTWKQLREARPSRLADVQRTPEWFYREWKAALTKNDRRHAETILTSIREVRPFQGINVRALQLITMAHFEDWKGILHSKGLLDATRSFLPRNAVESILKALFYIHIAPLLEGEHYDSISDVYRLQIQKNFHFLFRRMDYLRAPESLLLFRLFHFPNQSIPPSRESLIQSRLPSEAEEPQWHTWLKRLSQIAQSTPSGTETPTRTETPLAEASTSFEPHTSENAPRLSDQKTGRSSQGGNVPTPSSEDTANTTEVERNEDSLAPNAPSALSPPTSESHATTPSERNSIDLDSAPQPVDKVSPVTEHVSLGESQPPVLEELQSPAEDTNLTYMNRAQKHLDEGEYDEAFAICQRLPLNKNVVKLLLSVARYTERDETQQGVYNTLQTWMMENLQDLPRPEQKDWESLATQINQLQSWGSLFERVVEQGTVPLDEVLNTARRLTDAWDPNKVVQGEKDNIQLYLGDFFNHPEHISVWSMVAECFATLEQANYWSNVVFELLIIGLNQWLKSEHEQACLLHLLLWVDQTDLTVQQQSQIFDLLLEYFNGNFELHSIRWQIQVLKALQGRSVLGGQWEQLLTLLVSKLHSAQEQQNSLDLWDFQELSLMLPPSMEESLTESITSTLLHKKDLQQTVALPSLEDLFMQLKPNIGLGVYSLDVTVLQKLKEDYIDKFAQSIRWKPFSKTDARNIESELLDNTDVVFVVTRRAKHNVTYKIDNKVDPKTTFLRRCHDKGYSSLLRSIESHLRDAWQSSQWKPALFRSTT